MEISKEQAKVIIGAIIELELHIALVDNETDLLDELRKFVESE